MNHVSSQRWTPAGHRRVVCLCWISCVLAGSYAAGQMPPTAPILGDINNDGYVNVGDMQILVAAWGSQKTPPSGNWNAGADLNNDGYVNVGDMQLLLTNWGASPNVSILKNPLGRSTSFSSQTVGKVYVPSRYGGQLTVRGTNVDLIYTDGSDLQPGLATQIFQGGLSTSVVAQGNPSNYTVPVGRFGWFYIRLKGTTPATISSTFAENGQTPYRPWNGWWWPWNASEGPTLYNIGGPLDKYDHVHGTPARSWEAGHDIGGAYWFGHCWGWSIAAILLPQPQATTKNGVFFTQDDMEGLYTQLADNDPYFDAALSISFIPATAPTTSSVQDVDSYCDDLYRILRTCVREEGVPVQSDMRAIAAPPVKVEEVWNQSIYKYTSAFIEVAGQNDERFVQIDMTVYSNYGPWPPPTTYTNDRIEHFVYQLEFNTQGQVNPAAARQNWISASHYPPRDMYRLTGSPWISQNPHVTKARVDALYQP